MGVGGHFIMEFKLLYIFMEGRIWATMKYLANHKAKYIHILKLEF